MYIQIDLPKDLNKKIAILKIEYEMKNKEEVIVKILRDYFNKYGGDKK